MIIVKKKWYRNNILFLNYTNNTDDTLFIIYYLRKICTFYFFDNNTSIFDISFVAVKLVTNYYEIINLDELFLNLEFVVHVPIRVEVT